MSIARSSPADADVARRLPRGWQHRAAFAIALVATGQRLPLRLPVDGFDALTGDHQSAISVAHVGQKRAIGKMGCGGADPLRRRLFAAAKRLRNAAEAGRKIRLLRWRWQKRGSTISALHGLRRTPC